MPKVSVLMPVYKTEETYLRETIESVLAQTFRDFEFLIIDDYPDDDREYIIKSYNDARIKYFKNERNLGITPTRNRLIDMAEGEYLAVIDHDDIAVPSRFEKQVAYLEQNPHVGVVSSWCDCFPEKVELHFPAEDLEIKKLLTDICALVHPASMIRKSVLEEHNLRYEEEFSPAEDYCLWLRLIEFTNFHNIQEVLSKHRLYRENTTNKQWEKMQNATKILHFWVRNKHHSLYKEYLKDRTLTIKTLLFGFIPLLRIKIQHNKTLVYLLNCIPIISIHKKVSSWPK